MGAYPVYRRVRAASIGRRDLTPPAPLPLTGRGEKGRPLNFWKKFKGNAKAAQAGTSSGWKACLSAQERQFSLIPVPSPAGGRVPEYWTVWQTFLDGMVAVFAPGPEATPAR